MSPTFLAFGPFDPAAPAFAAAIHGTEGEFHFARTMAEVDLPQMGRRPDAVLVGMDAEDLNDFLSAFHTHPKLEGAPLLAVLPQLTPSAVVRASAFGADDFIAVADLSILLPRKLAAAAKPLSAPSRPSQCRVLLADASPLHAHVLARLLGQAGFEVATVADGPALLGQLEEPRGFGLLVVDLGLPHCDPATIPAATAEKLGAAVPPAIAMTHAGVAADVGAAALAGGYRHLHDKRRSPDELVFLANEASVHDYDKLRAAPRLLGGVLVGFRTEGGRWEYGLSHNLSLSGLFVRTIDPPPEGTLLELELTPPGSSTPIMPRARVVWRKDFAERMVRTAPTGMGLQFVDPDESVQQAMAAATHHLATQATPTR